MRVEQRNEVEERRVIRLLAGLADDAPDLPEGEVGRVLRSATARGRSMSGQARMRHRARFPAVAAAAVAALACLVQFDAPAARSSAAVSGSATVATFPEGNALELLLSSKVTR
jgi:hypothetical protein